MFWLDGGVPGLTFTRGGEPAGGNSQLSHSTLRVVGPYCVIVVTGVRTRILRVVCTGTIRERSMYFVTVLHSSLRTMQVRGSWYDSVRQVSGL